MPAYIKGIPPKIWTWFQKQSAFSKLLLVVPILCAVMLTLLVGNIGLAIMGTAIALNSLFVGWIGGFILLVLGKAGLVIVRDRKRNSHTE